MFFSFQKSIHAFILDPSDSGAKGHLNHHFLQVFAEEREVARKCSRITIAQSLGMSCTSASNYPHQEVSLIHNLFDYLVS